jgi:squalene synthase HpnC
MTEVADLRSGKGHRDENFPVASFLVRKEHRAPILAFYEFVRTADDIADHATLTPERKIELLDQLEADLLGQNPGMREAVALRDALARRGLSPVHAQDLLKAFRLDARKTRYATWDELMAYCAWSAMPVGRFVLDVHGADRATWPASDAVCAALQIINHLQDCGEDYRDIDRVYLPLDALTASGVKVEDLGAKTASPALRSCIGDLARRAEGLLRDGEGLASMIIDWRLSLEISVIHSLAARLARMLTTLDPLADETHLGKVSAGAISLRAIVVTITRRAMTRGARPATVTPS